MRADQDGRTGPERTRFWERLLREHVECGEADPAVVQGRNQCPFVDDGAPTDVDEDRAWTDRPEELRPR